MKLVAATATGVLPVQRTVVSRIDSHAVSDSPFQFALLTPSGRGAVATLLIQGDWLAHEDREDFPFQAAQADRRLSQQPLHRIWYGQWGAEEVVVCRVSDDRWEVYCHGGRAAVDALSRDLLRLGGRTTDGETLAFANLSGIEREFQHALQQATTWKTAQRLWQHPTSQFVTKLTDWSAAFSRGSHFSCEPMEQQVETWLSGADFGLHLVSPWQVILVGEPNVGKSSLLNRLAGFERAIVHHEPGTTRDLVTVECAVEGWPIRFIDSAGIRDTPEPLEALGIDRALLAGDQTDLVLHLFDVSLPLSSAERELRRRWPTALRVAHKSDLVRSPERPVDEAELAVSSQTGAGLPTLLKAIVARVIPRIPAPEAEFPVTPRQVRLLTQLQAQLRERALPEIRATLHELLAG